MSQKSGWHELVRQNLKLLEIETHCANKRDCFWISLLGGILVSLVLRKDFTLEKRWGGVNQMFFFCRQFMGTKVVAIFNCGALMERRVKPLGHLETACKHKADKWHHKVLERQNFFSYKLVLSDINQFANCKAERAGCCWADRSNQCSACAVH